MARTYETEAKAILERLGWRVRSRRELAACTKRFQQAWLLYLLPSVPGERLKIDGVPGPKTIAAMRTSDERRRHGQGTASEHFSFHEFRCTCGGKYASCARIWVRRSLLVSLEKYRTAVDRPVVIVSGCRCSQRNAAVGGAKFSQHLYGTAADVAPLVGVTAVRSMHAFAGIGYQHGTLKVRHVDRRDVAKTNPTHGTITNPTVWEYTS